MVSENPIVLSSSESRLDCRLAMVGFAGIAVTELKTGQSALEQLPGALPTVAALAIALTFAGLVPKFATGVSLGELLAVTDKPGAMGEGIAAVWTAWNEKVVGRTAMLGIAGLMATEAFLGHALF